MLDPVLAFQNAVRETLIGSPELLTLVPAEHVRAAPVRPDRLIAFYSHFREQSSESTLRVAALRKRFCSTLESYYQLPSSAEARANLVAACMSHPEDDTSKVCRDYAYMVSDILGLGDVHKDWPFATAAALIGKALSAEFGLEEAA